MWIMAILIFICIGFCTGDNSVLVGILKISGVVVLVIGVAYIIVFMPWLLLLVIVVIITVMIVQQLNNKVEKDIKTDNENLENVNTVNEINHNLNSSIEQSEPLTSINEVITSTNTSEKKVQNNSNLSFIDQLNVITRTPEEAAEIINHEKYIEAEKQAQSDYRYIKRLIKEKAENGEYESINNQKRIILYNEGSLKKIFRINTDIRTVQKLFSYSTKFTVIVTAIDYKIYKYYEEIITRLGKEDNISIEITGVYYSAGAHQIIQEFQVPGSLLNGDSVHADTLLKCTVYY